MGYIGDGPKPELEVGDISTKDVTATGDLTVDTNTLFVDASENKVGVGTTTVTDAGVAITPSVTRAGNWDAKLALQSTAASDFPALLFSGSNTTQYGGILGTTDTSGNVANNRTAQIAFLQSSSTEGNITFSTNGDIGTTAVTERMRVLSGGGLTFNGDTATTNALDDYEEGSWTPGIDGMTFTATDGVYTKIGKRVQCSGIISSCTSGTASAVGAKLTGLPYTVSDNLSGTSLEDGGALHYWINLGTTTSFISVAPDDGSTEAFMYRVAGSGGTSVTSVLRTDLDASDFACRMFFSYVST